MQTLTSTRGISSNDAKCGCQPPPQKPWEPPRLKLVVRGPENQVRHLNRPDAELDVIFDFMHHTMLVKETIKDPEIPGSTHSVCVEFNPKNSQFVNLEGLADGSLLFSFRILESACAVRGNKLHPREKRRNFINVESALFDKLVLCDWPRKDLQLFLPASRTNGWKTVALILLTFNKISTEKWRCLVNMKGSDSIAGLDWRQVETNINMATREKQQGMKFVAKLPAKMPLVYKNQAGVVSLQKSDEITRGWMSKKPHGLN